MKQRMRKPFKKAEGCKYQPPPGLYANLEKRLPWKSPGLHMDQHTDLLATCWIALACHQAVYDLQADSLENETALQVTSGVGLAIANAGFATWSHPVHIVVHLNLQYSTCLEVWGVVNTENTVPALSWSGTWKKWAPSDTSVEQEYRCMCLNKNIPALRFVWETNQRPCRCNSRYAFVPKLKSLNWKSLNWFAPKLKV